MKELLLATEALNLILYEDVSFRKAIKKVTSDGNEGLLLNVSALVGCELRHHLLLNEITKEFNDLDNKGRSMLYLAISIKFFLKKLDINEAKKDLKEVLSEENFKKADEILNFEGQVSDLVKLDHSSLEYVSIRFNTPKWLVKMWSKHFGRGQAFKILKSNIHPAKVFVQPNPCFECEELNKDLFEKVSDDLYLYKATSQIKHLDAHKKNRIFVSNPILDSLAKKYMNPLSNEFTFFSGSNDILIKFAHALSKGSKGVNFAAVDLDNHPELFRYLRVNNIRNINLFKYNDEYSLKAGISHKQDFILYEPASSSFEKIRLYPDYLIHFKRDDLDKIIEDQKKGLEAISEYLEVGGVLIYEVRTLNKKEGSGLVHEFVESHKGFALVEERQAFPNEIEDTSLYYAVIKREENND